MDTLYLQAGYQDVHFSLSKKNSAMAADRSLPKGRGVSSPFKSSLTSVSGQEF